MMVSATLLKFHPNWNIFANSSFKYAVVIVKKSPDTSNLKRSKESRTAKLNIDESTDLKLPEGAADTDGIVLGCTLCMMVGNCDGADESAIDGITDGNKVGIVDGDNDGASLCTKLKTTSVIDDMMTSELSRKSEIYASNGSDSVNEARRISSTVS